MERRLPRYPHGVSVGPSASPALDRAASGTRHEGVCRESEAGVAAEVAHSVTGLHIVYRYKLPVAPALALPSTGDGGGLGTRCPSRGTGPVLNLRSAGVPDRPALVRHADRDPPTLDVTHHLLGRDDHREATDPSRSLERPPGCRPGGPTGSVGVWRLLLASAGGRRLNPLPADCRRERTPCT
jgi:hypothetical protein